MPKKHGITGPLSTKEPTTIEIHKSSQISSFLISSHFFESISCSKLRERVLGRLNHHAQTFCTGRIHTFGSYRLGVHQRDADIDTLLIAPSHVTHTQFFTKFLSILEGDNSITDLSAVQDAYVPLIKLKISGISIDLLFARLTVPSLKNLNLLNDSLLKNMDEKSILSVNGCRVTDMLIDLVPCVSVFHGALRCVKYWAKRRGVYGNSFGYPGGVACAIMVARICQFYPNACVYTIFYKFFEVYAAWNWPEPVLLCEVVDMNYNLKVWDARCNVSDRYHKMPVITPAYPSMCSTHNVSATTLGVMVSEFRRGHEILKEGKCIDKMFNNFSNEVSENKCCVNESNKLNDDNAKISINKNTCNSKEIIDNNNCNAIKSIDNNNCNAINSIDNNNCSSKELNNRNNGNTKIYNNNNGNTKINNNNNGNSEIITSKNISCSKELINKNNGNTKINNNDHVKEIINNDTECCKIFDDKNTGTIKESIDKSYTNDLTIFNREGVSNNCIDHKFIDNNKIDTNENINNNLFNTNFNFNPFLSNKLNNETKNSSKIIVDVNDINIYKREKPFDDNNKHKNLNDNMHNKNHCSINYVDNEIDKNNLHNDNVKRNNNFKVDTTTKNNTYNKISNMDDENNNNIVNENKNDIDVQCENKINDDERKTNICIKSNEKTINDAINTNKSFIKEINKQSNETESNDKINNNFNGNNIDKTINHSDNNFLNENINASFNDEFEKILKKLFSTSDFFKKYKTYLKLTINDNQTWTGYIESKIRILCTKLESSEFYSNIINIQAIPFPQSFVKNNKVSYFVAIDCKEKVLVNLDKAVKSFLKGVNEWDKKEDTMVVEAGIHKKNEVGRFLKEFYESQKENENKRIKIDSDKK
ncbi:polynucleotide adenylyltransferase [Conglomerata obtusa]